MRIVTMVCVVLAFICVAMTANAKVTRVYEGKVNVNTASAADFTRLPGVGEVIAFRIIKERERRGTFRDVKELKQVKGISDRTYEGLKSYVAVNGENRLKVYIDLNTITKPLLLGLPGMSEGQARSILNFRKGGNRFQKVDDLLQVPGIDRKRCAELSEWLTVAAK